MAEHGPMDVLRVDGGLTRDPLLLQLQADAAGVPVQRGAVDATAAGAAALGAVGGGIWGSIAEIAERVPVGERVEPRRDGAWRSEQHKAWAPPWSGPPRSSHNRHTPAYGNMLAP